MGKVYHLGSADPSWGSPQSGVSVALVNAAGTIVATTATTGAGYFQFANVADGTYSYIYTLPAGEAFQAGGPVNTVTGVSTSFVVTAGSSQFTPTADVVSSSNTFTLNGAGAVALRGAGNYTVTGNASGGTLTLGNGNDSINLTGGGNTITVGAGNSTITALGTNNLITAGPGMSFITVDTSPGNKFVTNAAGQGLETISGFTSGDMIGLSQTLAGVSVASDLSNLGSYITAVTNGGNTTLLVNPSGSGTASAFVQLNGVTTTVAALVNGHNISLT
jgi:Ca2+-binding RTX toxin-like protein